MPIASRPKALLSATITLSLMAGTARGGADPTDLGVTDQATYEVFRDAVTASQYVRYDYALDQSPRVVVAVAGLAAFATQNPEADADQLADFIARFDQALREHAPGDPGLHRATNLIPAARYTTLPATGLLVGTDTRVGERIVQTLRLSIGRIENYDQILDRVTAFERARTVGFANSPSWLRLLVSGFASRDLDGNEVAHLSGVLRAYLESEDFEPVPDGVDDERFADVDLALGSTLPIDYTTYANTLNQPIETSTAWAAVRDGFSDIRQETTILIGELGDTLNTEDALDQDILDAENEAFMQQLADAYRADLDEVARYRAIIDANTMILLQNDDPSIRELATQAQSFAGAQLQTNETIAGINAGVQYASALTTFGFGIATGSPVDAITGLADVVLAGIELGDTFGGSSVPSAEEQIFDEILDMRDQLEDVRVQMNQRFDRIEVQLDAIYGALSSGFNELGESIFELDLNVQDLSTQIVAQRALLERIEEQLWGVANDLFRDDLATLVNSIVAYRDRRGEDLPYSGANVNFSDGIIELATKATFTASAETFAGGDGTGLTPMTASTLEINPVGRSINDLRMFPVLQLGAPFPLTGSRVVAPGPWAQAASAYAQVAHESPWSFAYMFETQSNSGLSNTDLDLIIAEGEALREMAENARSAELFGPLFGGYHASLDAIRTRFEAVRDSTLDAANVLGLDPWAGTEQQGRALAPNFSTILGRGGLGASFPAATSLGNGVWNLHPHNTLPELTAALLRGQNPTAGDTTVELRVTSGGFFYENDVVMEFRFIVDNHAGQDFVFNRRVTYLLTSFGSPVFVGNDGAAQDLFDQTPIFWFNIAQQFFTGSTLDGTSYNTINGLGDQITLEFIEDVAFESPATNANAYITARLDALQDDIWNDAIGDAGMDDLETARDGWASIIESYITIAMPDLFEQSTAVNAAFRGNPLASELSLTTPLDFWFDAQLGAGDAGIARNPADEFADRAAPVQAEVIEAADQPLQGHALIEWTLAELRDLRDGALTLAIDDTYIAAGTLNVPAQSGLIANDIDQPFRVIEIDHTFTPAEGLIEPQFGTLSLNPDGSFVYSPNAGFTGIDRFTYRTTAEITQAGDRVTSLPATVEIRVTAGPCNEADFAEPFGQLDFFDVASFLDAFASNLPNADIDDDNEFTFFDVQAYLQAFSTGCPE